MHKMMREAEYKALSGEGIAPGTFSAVVAAYGNVDSMGDRIVDGAFDKTLADWRKKGDPIPIILAHDWANPFSHIGYVMPDKVKSVSGVGLVVEEGHLDIQDNPTAAQVYRLMERRSLKQFSFGYTTPKGGQTRALDGANNLTELNLLEVGPCLKGINDKTQLLSIKAQLDAEERDLTLEERVAKLEAQMSVEPEAVVEDAAAEVQPAVEEPAPEAQETLEETVTPEDAVVEPEDESLKAMDPRTLDRELATMAAESALRASEGDALVQEVLVRGKADDTLRRLQDLEAELGDFLS